MAPVVRFGLGLCFSVNSAGFFGAEGESTQRVFDWPVGCVQVAWTRPGPVLTGLRLSEPTASEPLSVRVRGTETGLTGPLQSTKGGRQREIGGEGKAFTFTRSGDRAARTARDNLWEPRGGGAAQKHHKYATQARRVRSTQWASYHHGNRKRHSKGAGLRQEDQENVERLAHTRQLCARPRKAIDSSTADTFPC